MCMVIQRRNTVAVVAGGRLLFSFDHKGGRIKVLVSVAIWITFLLLKWRIRVMMKAIVVVVVVVVAGRHVLFSLDHNGGCIQVLVPVLAFLNSILLYLGGTLVRFQKQRRTCSSSSIPYKSHGR